MANKKQNDFDPNELIKASEDHEKSLAELQRGLKRLDNRVGSNASLAVSFKEAFENDKKMDMVLTSLICGLIDKDEDVKASVQQAVAKVDRKWWNGAAKKIVAAVGAIVLLIIGALIQKYILGG